MVIENNNFNERRKKYFFKELISIMYFLFMNNYSYTQINFFYIYLEITIN